MFNRLNAQIIVAEVEKFCSTFHWSSSIEFGITGYYDPDCFEYRKLYLYLIEEGISPLCMLSAGWQVTMFNSWHESSRNGEAGLLSVLDLCLTRRHRHAICHRSIVFVRWRPIPPYYIETVSFRYRSQRELGWYVWRYGAPPG